MLITRVGLALALGLAAKVTETPDFLQTDDRAGLARSGSQYCAPTAVSNSLMWMADHGAPRLRPGGRDAVRAQIELIRILADAGHMATRADIGTDAGELMHGVDRYLREHGYTPAVLAYQGWRKVPARWRASTLIDPGSLADLITQEKGAVWLNVGWYQRAGANYRRTHGHWVTLVGVDGARLLVHDPSPRAGAGPTTESLALTPLTAGTLTGTKAGLPRPAAGCFAVEGVRSLPRGSDTAILDGAVLLRLR